MKESLKILKSLILIFIMVMMMPIIVNAETIDVGDATTLRSYFSNGGEVRLTDDITFTANTAVNSDLVLDLNGHTLNMSDKTLVLYSKLTVMDSSSAQTGRITSTASFTIQIGSSTKIGELILNSGTIDCKGSYGIRNLDNSSLTINGGKVSGKDYVIYNQGSFTLNGGEVHASTGIVVQVYTNSNMTMNNGSVITDSDYQAINLYGDSSLTMNGGEIKALYCGGRYNGDGISMFKNTTVTINGGSISACGSGIIGNGSIDGPNEGTNAKIYFNGGTITAQIGLGIYAPQVNGYVSIAGGTISGETGIEIRAGRLDVTGGTINGTASEYSVREKSSGSTTAGAAISVAQHNTKQPIEVNVISGTLNAQVPFSFTNPQENAQESIDLIAINLIGGTYNSSGDQTIVSYQDRKIISGGVYTHDVANLILPEYGKYTRDNMYYVGKIHNVEIDDKSSDIASVDKENTPNGDVVTIKAKNKPGYRTIIEVIDKDGNIIRVDGNKFIMPDSDVKIKVLYEKILINPKTLSNGICILLILVIAMVFSGTIYYKKGKAF